MYITIDVPQLPINLYFPILFLLESGLLGLVRGLIGITEFGKLPIFDMRKDIPD